MVVLVESNIKNSVPNSQHIGPKAKQIQMTPLYLDEVRVRLGIHSLLNHGSQIRIIQLAVPHELLTIMRYDLREDDRRLTRCRRSPIIYRTRFNTNFRRRNDVVFVG